MNVLPLPPLRAQGGPLCAFTICLAQACLMLALAACRGARATERPPSSAPPEAVTPRPPTTTAPPPTAKAPSPAPVVIATTVSEGLTICQMGGPEVYFFIAGQRRHIVDTPTFLALGFRVEEIVDCGTSATLPEGLLNVN